MVTSGDSIEVRWVKHLYIACMGHHVVSGENEVDLRRSTCGMAPGVHRRVEGSKFPKFHCRQALCKHRRSLRFQHLLGAGSRSDAFKLI
eukprot:2897881-Amphidinium_carterae.3